MNRNQKIALGCGGGGCLGLILLAIAGGLIYFYFSASRSTPDYYTNINSNRNVNSNRNTNENDNSSSSSSTNSSASSLSNEDQHRLFHAASVTGDAELIRRVNVKLGLLNEDFTAGDKLQEFTIEHVGWAARNYQWIMSINTPEKARDYVNEHLQ
jgi:hypothetical protein